MPQKEKNNPKRTTLKSVFLTGSIKRMEDLREFSPTYVVHSLGFNHSKYLEKLGKPEMFTIKEIISIAELIDINPQIIMSIILNQLAADKKKKISPK